MRAEGRTCRGCMAAGALVFGMAVGAAQRATAQGLSGYAQIQYQEVTSRGIGQRFWIQTYQADHGMNLWGDLRLRSQLEINRSSAIGRPEDLQIPRGSIRLLHPNFGITLQRQPNKTTDAFGIVTRQQETNLNAYVAREGLPRLDVSWVRRHRDPNRSYSEQAGTTRSARLSEELGPLNLRFGYGDLTEETFVGGYTNRSQRNYDAGASMRVPLSHAVAVNLQYDFVDNRRGEERGRSERTRAHGFQATSGSRISTRTDWAFNYSYRRADVLTGTTAPQNDHQGFLSLSYHPTPRTRLLASSGVRTERTAEKERVLGYFSLSTSAEGQVRPGWRGTADMAHAVNGSADRKAFWVSSYRAGSRFQLARGLEFLADALASVNRDSAAVASRTVAQGSVGIKAMPVRAVALTYSWSFYNSGTSLISVSARSRTSSFDVRWQPSPAFSVGWTTSAAQSLPDGKQRTSSDQLNLDWKPSGRFQANAHLARARGSRVSEKTGSLYGNEVRGLRILAGLTQNLRAVATYSVTDPGTTAKGSALNLTLTRNFGR